MSLHDSGPGPDYELASIIIGILFVALAGLAIVALYAIIFGG